MWTRDGRLCARIPMLGLARLVSPLALLTLLLLTAVEGQAADLFAPVPDAPSALPDDELTLRSRAVSIDFTQLQHARTAVAPRQPLPTPAASPQADHDREFPQSRPQGVQAGPPAVSPQADRMLSEPQPTLTFNLFDDVVVTALVEHTAPTFSGGYSLSGHLVGEPLSTLTLVVNGETVAGTVRRLGETYHIRSVAEGVYAISEVDEPPFECGVEGPHPELDHQH